MTDPPTHRARRSFDRRARRPSLRVLSLGVAAATCLQLTVAAPPSGGTDGGGEALVATALSGEQVDAETLKLTLLTMSSDARSDFVDALDQISNSELARNALTASQRESVTRLSRSVERLPGQIVAELTEVDGGHPNARPMIAAGLDIVAEIGDASDVGHAFALAGPWPRKSRARFTPRPRELTRALTGILANDRGAFREIRSRYADAQHGFARSIVDALAKTEDTRSAVSLAKCLGSRPELDGLLLNRLHGIAAKTKPALHELELRSVRLYLDSPDAFQRQQSARCCGVLDDVGATEALIERLADDERSVVRAAHSSLKTLTAMTIGADIRRWRTWYREQESVWSDRRGELFALASDPRDPRFARSMNQLALLRMRRAEIAPMLIELAEDTRDTEALRLVCAAVESLRAESALDAMVALLDHDDGDVAARAHRTLAVVTGLQLPPDPQPWRRALKRR